MEKPMSQTATLPKDGVPEACATCPAHNLANLVKLGVDMEKILMVGDD